jgi:hypothetical protein
MKFNFTKQVFENESVRIELRPSLADGFAKFFSSGLKLTQTQLIQAQKKDVEDAMASFTEDQRWFSENAPNEYFKKNLLKIERIDEDFDIDLAESDLDFFFDFMIENDENFCKFWGEYIVKAENVKKKSETIKKSIKLDSEKRIVKPASKTIKKTL